MRLCIQHTFEVVALFQSEKPCKGYSRLCHNFVVMRCIWAAVFTIVELQGVVHMSLKLDRMLNDNLVQKSLFWNSVFLLWHGSVGLHTYDLFILNVEDLLNLHWLNTFSVFATQTSLKDYCNTRWVINIQMISVSALKDVCAGEVKLFSRQKYRILLYNIIQNYTELPSWMTSDNFNKKYFKLP